MQLYSSQIVSKNLNGNVEKTVTIIKNGKKTVTTIKNGKKTTRKTKLNGKSPIPPIIPPMLHTSSQMGSPNFISPFLTILRRNPCSLKKITKKRTLKDSGGKIKKKRHKILYSYHFKKYIRSIYIMPLTQ